jgi:hypothetical protein
MKNYWIVVMAAGALAISGAAQTGASAAANGAGATLENGTTLQVKLIKPIDAKKAKAGDEVAARLTQDVKSGGHIVLHKGTKILGHVTEAQAKTKDNAESRLGVVFDHAQLRDGSQITFSAVVQALAAASGANAQGSVISSTTRNVKLDSGTQMVLQVHGSPQR